MKKNTIPLIALIFSIISFIVAVVSLFAWCGQANNKKYNASDIYKKGIVYTAEVKAVSDDVGECFGTGVLVSEDGSIITNAHVVTYNKSNQENTFDEYYIRFAFEEEYRCATLEKYDSEADLAMLKITDISSVTLSPVRFGDFSKVDFGDRVFAIGNASNYGIGVFEGIVSVPLVNIESDGVVRSVIQCDLTIASGNSGGALLNEKNELIGITTFRIKDDTGKIVYGIVYCIPVDEVIRFING